MEAVTSFHSGAIFLFNDDLRLEVTYLSPRTARVTWQPGQLPYEYAVESELTVALKVDSTQVGDAWRLATEELSVMVFPNGRVEYSAGSQIFRQDDPPVYQAPGWRHTTPLAEDAKLFGLGERSGFSLRGGKYSLWNKDIGGSYGYGADPLYLTIPVYFCRQEMGSYLTFYENSHEGWIEFNDRSQAEFVDGALRMYVMTGSLSKTLEEYSRLTGSAPLPPRWALGYHQCRWGYKSADEVRSVVEGFKQHSLPLDVFHLDIDYMDGYRIFTVNEKNFPNLGGLAAELEEEGIKLVTIIDPGVKIDSDYHVYQSGVDQDVFCKYPDGKRVRGLVWPGWVHFPDFTNPLTRRWWGELYKPFMDAGVDGFWHDMNEPASFSAFGENTLPRATCHSFDGREGKHAEGHNLYGALMNRAGFEGVSRIAPEKRPWFLTRSGWAGVQRYAWKWTGDVETSWDALKMTIGTVLGTGISGIPYSGSDIGGFSGSPDGELFVRWFQMSAFMALFRNHAAIGAPLREPWQFGEPVLSICRDFLQVRKTLMPYFYSLAWDAHRTGAPLARPVAWVDESDSRLWDIDDAFMLGDAILAAPVVEAGAKFRSVVLPNGRWYSFWDDVVFEGGTKLVVETPLERMPVFVREGVVLPKSEAGCQVLHYYLQSPSAGDVVSQRYVDEGDGYGNMREDTFTTHHQDKTAILRWQRKGAFPLEDQIRIVVHGANISRAWVDGIEQDWTAPFTDVRPFNTLRLELK
jgi:alpha-glucosidase